MLLSRSVVAIFAGAAIPVNKPLHHENGTVLFYRSSAPPFLLAGEVTGGPREGRERRLKALVKDALAHLASEALSKPMAEVVVAYPDDPDRARAVMEQWPRLKRVFDAVAPLAPDFPKVMRTEEFTWDPGQSPGSGKALIVLGICPSSAGQRLRDTVGALFSTASMQDAHSPKHNGVQSFVADSEGLTVMCPEVAMREEARPRPERWAQPDGSALALASTMDYTAEPGEVAIYGAAVLQDANGHVLDYAPFELRQPEEKDGVRLGECWPAHDERNQRLGIECRGSWPQCQNGGSSLAALRFEARDGKIAVVDGSQVRLPQGCQAPLQP